MNAQPQPPVVVGVDGSKDGLIALDWAIEDAALRRLPLRVVHVVDDQAASELAPAMVRMLTPDDGTDILEDAADELAKIGVGEAMLEIRHGHPAQTLLEAGRPGGLLIVGRRGLDGFAELAIGSTSQVCAALAGIPVVVVPDQWNPVAPSRGRVVVGVDGSESCQLALGFAFEEAALRSAGVLAVHAVRLPDVYPGVDIWPDPDQAGWSDQVERLLTSSLAGWPERYPDVGVERQIVGGHPVQVLAAASETADLVVVGGRGRSLFTALRMGSVSRGLLHHTACPVAIIHQGAEE